MATLTTGQCTAACDNLAQVIADAVASVPTSSQLTTLTADLTTEITRIQALTDALAQTTLERAWTREARTTPLGNLLAGRLITYLSTMSYAAILQNGPFEALDALDFLCSQVGANTGLASFLANNSLAVDHYFADLFNQFAITVASGAYVRFYGTSVPAKIPSSSVFPHASVDYVNQWTATSASAGTFALGTATLAALTGGNTAPGGGTLEAYAGSTIGASSYTVTVTYTTVGGTAGQTVTCAVVASATANTVCTPGASVQASSIQSVAVTTGSATNGDVLRFRLKPIRTVTA